MEEKPYIATSVSFGNEKYYILYKIAKYCSNTILVARNIEELMIMLDLNGYDRNEIRIIGELKDYA